jgi:hypothetical protein
MTKLLSYSPLIQVLTLILVGVLVFGGSSVSLGGTTNYDALDVTDGYYVDGSQVVDGSGNWIGVISSANDLTVTGDVRLKSPIFSGSIGSIVYTAGATTSVITAAQVCDGNYATTTPSITAASTLNTPSMVTLVADCLTTNGDTAELVVLNTTASTTVVTAGASSTLYYDGATGGSATLAASSMAILKFIRTSATTLLITMSQYKP